MLLIDTPVTPYSSAMRIRAWIDELEEMRVEFRADRDALATIEQHLITARGWLQGVEARSKRRDESAA
jgi:hypothetical protein